VNHKRLFRIYRAAGLSVKRKRRKRLVRACQPRTRPTAPNEEWLLDFVRDRLANGGAVDVLGVMNTLRANAWHWKWHQLRLSARGRLLCRLQGPLGDRDCHVTDVARTADARLSCNKRGSCRNLAQRLDVTRFQCCYR
jgi:hypothetical protein